MKLSKRSAVRPIHRHGRVLRKRTGSNARDGASYTWRSAEPGAPTPARRARGGRGGPSPTAVSATRKPLACRRSGRRIARHYGERYGIDVPESRIAVTTGSSGAFNLAFLALFDPGDRVGLPAARLSAYRNILTALGLDVVENPLRARDPLAADAGPDRRRRASGGPRRREPRLPLRHDDDAARAPKPSSTTAARRASRWSWMRDLSRPRLRGDARRARWNSPAGRGRRELLLQILIA